MHFHSSQETGNKPPLQAKQLPLFPQKGIRGERGPLVAETRQPGYLQAVRRVMNSGRPVHLIAGQNSAAAWDVPDFVRTVAASYTEQPGVGHLMMLEDPQAFCRSVDGCLPNR